MSLRPRKIDSSERSNRVDPTKGWDESTLTKVREESEGWHKLILTEARDESSLAEDQDESILVEDQNESKVESSSQIQRLSRLGSG